MPRHFAAEGLSEEARALIDRMYSQENAPFSQIQIELKALTGEEIALASLHRFCKRKLQPLLNRIEAAKIRATAKYKAYREMGLTPDQVAEMALMDQIMEEDDGSIDRKTAVQEQRRREEGRGRKEIEDAKLALEREKLEHERAILNFKERISTQAATAAEEVQKVVKSNGLSDAAAAEIRAKILGVAS